MIPYFRLRSNPKELEELTNVHQNSCWVNGDYTSKVDEQLKALFKKKHVVLTSNGSSALFLALKVLGVEGKEVIVPCVSTCFAITNAVISSGNTPVFCDINKSDGNCDIEHVTQLVKQRGIKNVISANFAGNISAVNEFKKLGLTVIEDACQSFHSSLHFASEADIQVLSFYPTKGINGIDGGALLLNDADLAKKISKMVYYDDQTDFENSHRYNFRFLNAHAAVLYANLNSIKQTEDCLSKIASSYRNVISKKKGVSLMENPNSKILQRFVIRVDNAYKLNLINVFEEREIALSPFFGWNCKENERNNFVNASMIINNAFCLPYFEDLSDEELDQVNNALDHVFT